MKKSFFNKHALVCGSTDGIGKESALQLAKNGCEVTLISRNEKKLIQTLGELSTGEMQNHSFLVADFNETSLLEKKICDYVKNLNKPIHILVNNSGGPKGGSLLEAGLDEFRQTFERLLIANQIITQAVAPTMKKNNYGRIINIISTSVKQVIPGLGVSNTIRGSVAQWAKTLAMELGPFGISVNNILPGYTTTKRLQEIANNKADKLNITAEEVIKEWEKNTTLKRLGTPSEIANVITFLSSDKSSYITGQNLSVDGGRIGV